MLIEVLFLGKTKEDFISAGIEEYLSRLRHYTQIKIRTLKVKGCKNSNEMVLKEQESALLLDNIPAGAYIVALDSRGQLLTSEELAKLVERWEQQGLRKISFIIGGPLGLTQGALRKADLSLSLSPMTFTHDMTRMLLLEQLYRAYTIKAGEKYHK